MELVVEPVGRGGLASGHVDGDCERNREALLLEAGRMQVEDQLPEAGDRDLHGELGIGQHAELVGIAERSPEQLQAHAHGRDDLDRVVVDVLGDAPALVLTGSDELDHELVAGRRGVRLRTGAGLCEWDGCLRRSRREWRGAFSHA